MVLEQWPDRRERVVFKMVAIEQTAVARLRMETLLEKRGALRAVV
jgi:hypothetical protein